MHNPLLNYSQTKQKKPQHITQNSLPVNVIVNPSSLFLIKFKQIINPLIKLFTIVNNKIILNMTNNQTNIKSFKIIL